MKYPIQILNQILQIMDEMASIALRLRRRSMFMAMMDVGEVRMVMGQRRVFMLVIVRIDTGLMAVLVMFVVHVRVGVPERLVRVRVAVVFADDQPRGDRHQGQRQPEQAIDGLVQENQRQSRTNERGRAEVRAGAGTAEMSQGIDEQDEAHAITA